LESPSLLEAYAAQVVDAIHAAAAKFERVVLVGQSMGGAVAELAAGALGDQVAGLILVNPAPLAGSALSPDVVEMFEALSAQRAVDAATARTGFAFRPNEEVAARYRIATPEEDRNACLESFRAWRDGHPAGRVPSRVAAPTLLVVSDDTFFPEAMLRADVATRFANIDIAQIRGAGHDPHIETPDLLAATIGNFIGPVLGRIHQTPSRGGKKTSHV
jgi:pimeloyl-ACP methyl ester carboxylesterase